VVMGEPTLLESFSPKDYFSHQARARHRWPSPDSQGQ